MEKTFLLSSLVLSQKLPIPTCDHILCWMQVRNEKTRRYLTSMRKKQPVSFAQKFPNADPLALRLLEKLLAFDPKKSTYCGRGMLHYALLLIYVH